MNSKIILCRNINVDRNYNNVLNYNTEQMLSLCNNNKVASADNYSFIRNNTNTINTNFSYSDCLQSNYIAFQNTDYSSKWFFAWIDEVIYTGDRNTTIKFTVDAWSTWFSDWNVKPCYVTRHHVNDDTIGANTIPENIDVGEVVQEFMVYESSFKQENGYYIGVMTDWLPNDGTDIGENNGKQFSGISIIDGTVSGSKVIVFQVKIIASGTEDETVTGFDDLVRYIIRTNADGHINDIKSIFIIPDFAINEGDITGHTCQVSGASFTYYTVASYINPTIIPQNIKKTYRITGYTPKNNKCFVYPYYYINVTNNQGSNNIFKQENFAGDTDSFEYQFTTTVGGSGRIVPKNYKGIDKNYEESVPLGKYPTCGWSSDEYINWLTQNSVNNITSILQTGISTVTSVATGNATGLISNAGSIAGIIGQFRSELLAPNIQGSQPTGDVAWTSDSNFISIRFMHAKVEYMRVIDNYFSRFGYKIERVTTPNITGRANWNYVEISPTEEIGYGNVPTNFMEQINNACRKGVTIWHNHDNIGNYNLDNNIV